MRVFTGNTDCQVVTQDDDLGERLLEDSARALLVDAFDPVRESDLRVGDHRDVVVVNSGDDEGHTTNLCGDKTHSRIRHRGIACARQTIVTTLWIHARIEGIPRFTSRRCDDSAGSPYLPPARLQHCPDFDERTGMSEGVPSGEGRVVPSRSGAFAAIQRWWAGGPLDDDFGRIAALLDLRTDALIHAMEKLESSAPEHFADRETLFRLAAVDLFVEKAQAVLTARARRMSRAGAAASFAAVLALLGLSLYIAFHTTRERDVLTTNELVIRVVSAISLGAIVLVAVKYMIALARSFFHESVTLLSRRHALRFGRMYLYLNPKDVKLDHLREAFDWNRGGESSFLDIKPGEIGQTPYSALAVSVGEAVAKAIESAQDARRNDRGS
ncbi:hypothetical protein ACVW00_003551 [Marmoricola sp. URHA0025 HA25]